MTQLLDLLGKHVSSPEATTELARYPGLKPEAEDVESEDGVDPVYYLRSEPDGLLITVSADGHIRTIFLMSEGREGFSQFQGELPANLTFAAKASDALKALGAPAYNRPPGRIGTLQHGELLRFDLPNYSLHLLFRAGGAGIELITAKTPQSVPGR
jgi:hypothetical protein